MATQYVISQDVNMVDLSASKYIFAERVLCNDAMKERLRGLEYSFAQYPFYGGGYYNAAEYVCNLTKRVIKTYGEVLNKHHRVDYSERQWRILFSTGLYSDLFDYYYRYTKLKDTKEKERDLFMIGPRIDWEKTQHWSDLSAAIRWMIIAEILSVPHEFRDEKNIVDGEKTYFLKKLILNPGRAIRFGARIAINRVRRIGEGNKIAAIQDTTKTVIYRTNLLPEQENRIYKDTGKKVWPLNAMDYNNKSKRIITKYNKCITQRYDVLSKQLAVESKFDLLVEKLIINTLPVSLLEAFREIRQEADRITNRCMVDKVYVGDFSDNLVNFCVANMKGKGAVVTAIEHSFWYCYYPASMIAELLYGDVFFTWGWGFEGFPFLESCVKRGILARVPKYNHNKTKLHRDNHTRILFAPVAGRGLLDNCGGMILDKYVDREMMFIDELDDDVRRNLTIRINPNDIYNRDLLERCKKYTDIKYENRFTTTFGDSVLNVDIVICDYFSSPCIEALYLGIPVLIFDGVEVAIHNPKVDRWISLFSEKELYFSEGQELACAINKRKERLLDWLEDDVIKSVYSAFLNDVARGAQKENIELLWEKELMQ